MPKVSVIIPTYNRAEFLRSTITSVLNQTFQDFEIIVIDDASQDHTREVVSSFGDKRIRYIRHETNKRVAAARNTGVISSKGTYIAFLDDDDEWFPEKLQKQFDLLEACPPTIGVVYAGAFVIGESSKKILAKISPKKRGDVFDTILTQNRIAATSTIFLRSQCFEKVGLFDESLGFADDYDMWLRISKEFQFEYINEPLINYLLHDDQPSLSHNYEAVIRDTEILLKKHAPLLASNNKGHSGRYRELGEIYCCTGDIRKGREAFIKAIKLYPLEIKHYYSLFLSLLGAKNFKKFKESKDRIILRLRESFGFICV
jgi:glycosyltransferase involved in cell wall biosynthesis